MDRLRAAFSWLKEHNQHYQAIAWDEEAAVAWGENPELPSREEDIDSHVDVDQALFCRWMDAGRTAQGSGDVGFNVAQTLFDLLYHSDVVEASDDDVGKLWFRFLDTLADYREKKIFRRAQTVSTLDIGYVLLRLQRTDGSSEIDDAYDYPDLKAIPAQEWPQELQGVVNEITALRIEQVDMTEVQEAGATDDAASLPSRDARSSHVLACILNP
jgi:hypothetical protein